jgi:serine protease Do
VWKKIWKVWSGLNTQFVHTENIGRYGRIEVRILRRALTIISVVLFGFAMMHSPAIARSAPESFADLAARLLPSVVNISTTQVQKKSDKAGPEMPRFPEGSPFQDFFKEFFDRQQRDKSQRRATSLGSGFIISSAGLVVTNNHVIAGADEITVTLHDDTELKAKLLGRDAKTDLALLKVWPKSKKLTAVPFGDSERTRVGDWVVAIGNPFGLGGTVTAGIVSARQRDINSGPYDDFIQTDASINRATLVAQCSISLEKSSGSTRQFFPHQAAAWESVLPSLLT